MDNDNDGESDGSKGMLTKPESHNQSDDNSNNDKDTPNPYRSPAFDLSQFWKKKLNVQDATLDTSDEKLADQNQDENQTEANPESLYEFMQEGDQNKEDAQVCPKDQRKFLLAHIKHRH